MSAFLGYDDIGVWVTNFHREAFLDWFADNRCVFGDARWKVCKSDDWRWPGCDIELSNIIPLGMSLDLTGEEYDQAVVKYGPTVAQLLGVIDAMTRGEYTIRADSDAAYKWQRPKR